MVRRKTLHRWMNDLLGSWEEAGVEQFIILTAHGHDPHQEALSTLRTNRARVFTVDVFALDLGDLLLDPDSPTHGGELDTSLLLHLAPHLVRMDQAQDFLPTGRIRAPPRARPDGAAAGHVAGVIGAPHAGDGREGRTYL